MSGGISGQISKGIVHQKVDHVLNYGNRAAFLAGLRNATTSDLYLTMLRNSSVMGPDILTQAEATYLQSTWYNQDPTTGWWWQAQPIYPILRQGLFKAIREAGTLPIDSYWLPVTTGNLVAVLVAVSECQATRIIITPPSPYLDKQSRSPARIWEIKRGHDGFPADEDKEPALLLADDVVTPDTTVNVWRRKERPYP